jgi:hypothetical protein
VPLFPAHPEPAVFQVDVAPAEQPQLLLAQPEPRHERDGHLVAERRLRGDDPLRAVGVVRMALNAALAWPVEPGDRVRHDPVEAHRPGEERGEHGERVAAGARRCVAPAAGD